MSPETDATTATWVPTTTVRPTNEASNVRPACLRVLAPYVTSVPTPEVSRRMRSRSEVPVPGISRL